MKRYIKEKETITKPLFDSFHQINSANQPNTLMSEQIRTAAPS